MKDYSRKELYRRDTPADARFHYAQDLLRQQCCKYSDVLSNCNDCSACGFPELMGVKRDELEKTGCCGWLVEGEPGKAILVLENLLGIRYEPDFDSPWAIKTIADHNGLNNALDLMQEECAELVQAISKRRRYPDGKALDHIIEEMADVSILLDERACLLPCGSERLRRWRDEKVERTLDRCGLLREEEPRTETPEEAAVWDAAMEMLGSVEQELPPEPKIDNEGARMIRATLDAIEMLKKNQAEAKTLHVSKRAYDLMFDAKPSLFYTTTNLQGGADRWMVVNGHTLRVLIEPSLGQADMVLEQGEDDHGD